MYNEKELYELGLAFHGHRCPAMPLGLRAAIAAMEVLGVERAKDKELFVISETGKGHAAGCFLDGIMTSTGCTYGKSNIKKLYYNKMAFTLIDVVKSKAVRVSLKPSFVEKMLSSPFVQERKKGTPPQDVNPKIANPLIENVLSMPYENFLNIEPVKDYIFENKKSVFDTRTCAVCGEQVFVDKLEKTDKGEVCLACKK
jgi:formylmethanofuran dehydrogenase subunit E